MHVSPFTIVLLACLLSPLFGCEKRDTQHELEQWHTLVLSFEGPSTSETDQTNPFTEYRLLVTFTHEDADYRIRGFYAADGNAAETGAESGSVWQVRFTPDQIGEWTYEAKLQKGPLIAIDDDPLAGESIKLSHPKGAFTVVPSSATGRDFRAHGRIVADAGYFRIQNSDTRWLKGGADSPENFLAYEDFDGTYRHNADVRDGESQPSATLHTYAPHIQDLTTDDPTWQDGKGKGIIGAVNYLASTGMNALYFLTLNINGDGKDVWPYRVHADFTRFDCSKLDQWEIVFRHMESKGVLMHLVTQETENERLLDDGDTGIQRKLYYRELIARFGHRLGLVWNLGEENGPADFSPFGQTSEQQRAMASYLKASDPYKHPVVIHTHSEKTQKDELLPALLGHEPLDGLSFQVNHKEDVHDEIIKWKRLSRESGYPWLITMDEIGLWHTGTVPDSVDPHHDELRRYVLWGSLLGGAAGVEWYFGAHQEGNDLTTEDWRSRANMWEQTRHCLEFFQSYLPYWKMQPSDTLTPGEDNHCLALPGELYALYTPNGQNAQLDLQDSKAEFRIHWYAPKTGGALQTGSAPTIAGPGLQNLGSPPSSLPASTQTDWVALIRKIEP